MIEFILNNQNIKTDKPSGMSLLDYLRYEAHLKGTKIGCREGDCGACTVIAGKLKDGALEYKTIVSCLTPLCNVQGKHIVTIEGINTKNPGPVQQGLMKHNGTQCGFCTPGFVVSLTWHMLSNNFDMDSAIAAIDGNICRCTGYKSIERATVEINEIKKKCKSPDRIKWLIEKDFLPEYFSSVQEKLVKITPPLPLKNLDGNTMGGGTDLMVQLADELIEQPIVDLFEKDELKKIEVDSGYCTIGGEATADDIMNDALLLAHFPKLKAYFKLISSTAIRNMGTLAGNIANASPIGDLTIFFLALNADLHLIDQNQKKRKLPLQNIFLGYKKLDLRKSELIEKVGFQSPDQRTYFNFEKVSKRTHLDIASVNTAISIRTHNGYIEQAFLSAGGVGPTPLLLKKTSAYLIGKKVSTETISETNKIVQSEISPISDIRGSADYKRLLLRQLIFAHFIELFPEKLSSTELLAHLVT